jgi:hypothetical protein
MANCNECKSLEVVIETDDDYKNFNHICAKHGISLRYTAKRFRGYIWPSDKCNGDDFEEKTISKI